MIIFLKRNKPIKFLSFKKVTHNNGRSYGVIVSRHRGGGYKFKYRSLDFYRTLWNIYGLVLTIEYNPTFKKLISLVFYLNGVLSYIFYIKGLIIGNVILSSYKTPILLGNNCFLNYIPYGTFVHSVQFKSKQFAKFSRSPGSYLKVLGKFKKFVLIKLKSGTKKILLKNCSATIGVISDFMYLYSSYSLSAGDRRNNGWRPKVRGVAMNAVDHPNGGGKGKKAGKVITMSPWGKLPKGKSSVSIK